METVRQVALVATKTTIPSMGQPIGLAGRLTLMSNVGRLRVVFTWQKLTAQLVKQPTCRS